MQTRWKIDARVCKRADGDSSDGYIIRLFIQTHAPTLGCWLRADNEELLKVSTEIYDQVQQPPPPPSHDADFAIKQQPTLKRGPQQLQSGDPKY